MNYTEEGKEVFAHHDITQHSNDTSCQHLKDFREQNFYMRSQWEMTL